MDRLTDRTIGIPNDFIRRKRHGRFLLYVIAYAVALVTVLLMALFHDFFGAAFVLAAAILIFGGLTLFSLIGMQRLLDLVLSVEFQNAIFSSAFTRKFDFTMIVDNEGSIAYYDQGFKTYFPDIPSAGGQAIGQLLSRAGILGDKEREITNAVFSGGSGDFLLDVPLDEERVKRFHVSFAPVIRPVGFYVLQGRAYVERNENGQSNLTTDTLSMLQGALLHGMEDGAYIADANGYLLYINPALAKWLGYSELELSQRSFPITELLYTVEGNKFPGAKHGFDSEVLLRRHNGSLMHSIVHQRSIVPPSSEPLGMVGIVKRKDS